jgi:hypothetical protein
VQHCNQRSFHHKLKSMGSILSTEEKSRAIFHCVCVCIIPFIHPFTSGHLVISTFCLALVFEKYTLSVRSSGDQKNSVGAQMLECLPGKPEALSLVFSTTKK